ncbi:hypothetical protein J6590_072066 [Homalodisca vitripennis]|nr:hypothetical protein J6590_072066 [Homalodisca vitripennis]
MDLETSVQGQQSEYGDPLSNPRQKKTVSRTVGPRSRPGTHCPPLQKQVRYYPDSFTTWTYSPFTLSNKPAKYGTEIEILNDSKAFDILNA